MKKTAIKSSKVVVVVVAAAAAGISLVVIATFLSFTLPPNYVAQWAEDLPSTQQVLVYDLSANSENCGP